MASNLPDLDDDWYAGDDGGYAQEASASTDYEAFGKSYVDGAASRKGPSSSSKYGEVGTDLHYDSHVLPPFLVKKNNAAASSTMLASGEVSDTLTFSKEQDIRLPVKDPMSRLAVLAKEGSEALRLFRREEAQRKANREATDTTHSTVNTLLRQHELNTGASITEDEYERLQRQARVERLRNATEEERLAIEAEEREAEAKALKAQGSMRAIDGGGAEGGKINGNANASAIDYEKLRDKLAASRRRLPVYKCRDALMSYIAANQVCVIEGETGSGKTTQLVQYLLEDGYARDGMIGCTQPRKVAAVGVSKRVADEVGCALGTTVGYAVRLDNNSGPDTKIKFMTEGVLLREVINDPDVNKYSVIILDEAHERSINTDVLLGVLKSVIRRRSDLKVIVTSATLNTAKFSEFFYGAKTFKIEGKTFPVDVVYEAPLALAKADYIEEVVSKVLELHLDRHNLLAGTGDKRPREEGEGPQEGGDQTEGSGAGDNAAEDPKQKEANFAAALARLMGDDPDEPIVDEKTESTGLDILVFLPGKEEILSVIAMVQAKLADRPKRFLDSLWILPLYSELPPAQQLKVLEPTPKGMRKCVVSTNVAETSLTIDGIRFVVDAGFMRTNVYRPAIGMNSLQTYPISQAEANQRKGRAGRTARGVCYRLYSEEQFHNEMLVSPVPEIQRSSIDSVVLLLKSIGVDNILHFDFIDSPPEATIRDSCYKLWLLGALDPLGKVTKEGLTMLEFPVEPSLAKMLLVSTNDQFKCSEEMLSIAAVISAETRTLYVNPQGKEDVCRQERSKFNVANSDHLTLLNIFMQFLRSGKSKSWCRDNYLDHRTLQRAVDIRAQFTDKMKATRLPFHPHCRSIDDVSDRLRQVLVYGHISQIAKRIKWNEYESLQSAVTCSVSPTSAIVEAGGASMPDYCLYHEFRQTTKEYMCLVTEVQPEWVVKACKGVIRERGVAYDAAYYAAQAAEEERRAEAQTAERESEQQQRGQGNRRFGAGQQPQQSQAQATAAAVASSSASSCEPILPLPMQAPAASGGSSSLAQSLRDAAAASAMIGIGGSSLFAAPPSVSATGPTNVNGAATDASTRSSSVATVGAMSSVASATTHGAATASSSSAAGGTTSTPSAATVRKPAAPKPMSLLELQKLKMAKAKKNIL